MSLPGDHDIQFMLMDLLLTQRGQKSPCADVYNVLAKSFTQLTRDEKTVPYWNSWSHWENRIHSDDGGGIARWNL